jgi:hypothetical protein
MMRDECSVLKVDEVKRMKELETENARLRRTVSDLRLEKLVLNARCRIRIGADQLIRPVNTARSATTTFMMITMSYRK